MMYLAILLIIVICTFLFLCLVLTIRARRLSNVFEKYYRLLLDEEAQVALFPNLTNYLKVNESGRCVGQSYGLSPTDPIRVNGPLAELLYISRLSTRGGAGFIGHRLGSIAKLDVYEIASTDFSEWLIIWFDMYWSPADVIAPKGLNLAKARLMWPDSDAPGVSAVNRFLVDFPEGYWQSILESTKILLGYPIVKTNLKTLDTSSVQRPRDHARLIKQIVVMARAEGLGPDS